ncbi:hypothetical protein [Cytophaga aurantiaca]|uniref:hypothetical protein n=1 Tax=Cytophaga aurantiaca TaxID=29530 RepID=UPI00035F6BB6|nr:hypothetical protein [Cytophaga aurantiaca]
MTPLTKKIVKRLLITLGVAAIVAAIQFTTYNTIAKDKLSKTTIQNLIVNDNFGSDSIIISSASSVIGNMQQRITPYPLHFSSKENRKLLKKKLQAFTVLNEKEYTNYSNKIAEAALPDSSAEAKAEFVANMNKNKSRLYVTALEEQTFIVAVNTTWTKNSQIQYEEDRYLWILFFWTTI